MSGAALSGSFLAAKAFAFDTGTPELFTLSSDLLTEWAAAVLRLQVIDKTDTKSYGGIYCPADKAVHGRSGDTIYPFVHLAAKKQDSKYLDAAVLLYRWMETHVSQPDGSWLNEPVAGSWKGTTVFASIALGETLKQHGHILERSFKNEMTERLNRAGNFIYENFHIKYGNINYPVTAAYGLSLLGELLGNSKFSERGKALAHESLAYFTKKDGLLYGEGDVAYEPSPKGCLAIDLGYNVEESLPALVQYGLLNNDATILETVTHSMQKHLEFMLPDGAWDNSWGTRNFKWTYWGSRTSDGCQIAYTLLADRDPRFYKAALLNTKLMKQCTSEGLLTGGPHYHAHKITPCVHHTFSHMKALATVLDHGIKENKSNTTDSLLPREKMYAPRFFEDIQTWLISKGKFRATITAYDKEYKKTKNGHASGGALTMLWHEKTGPLLCASMNDYQLYEAGNMQRDTDTLSMPLTPRIELQHNGTTYSNISDLTATVKVAETHQHVKISTRSKLVDGNQQSPSTGIINCSITYTISDNKVILDFQCDQTIPAAQVRIVLPVISLSTEKTQMVSEKRMDITKEKCVVKISADHKLERANTRDGRIFNYVPGFEATPFVINDGQARIEITLV